MRQVSAAGLAARLRGRALSLAKAASRRIADDDAAPFGPLPATSMLRRQAPASKGAAGEDAVGSSGKIDEN
ncbi:hypothetical protein Sa4125_12330 [Aureimonas sp. SA4125]|nr:hypothetical protein Sa4125_12330 [Aureimonas sp. SA4125]